MSILYRLHSKQNWCLIATFIIVASACKNKEQPAVADKLFTEVTADQSNIHFANHIEEKESWNYLNYFNFYSGGGVAIGDVNNDGLSDIFFTGNQVQSRLYLNKGQLRFEDITQQSGIVDTNGWSTGAVMADANGDGLLDIYLCKSGRGDSILRQNQLYINNGDLTFSEKATEMGVADLGYSIHASFFDYDNDHDLDLFVANHPEDFHQINSLFYEGSPDSRKFGADCLYRNEGNGKFIDVSREAGIIKDKGFSLSVCLPDVNKDGWADIYVANDFWEEDLLYINNGDGTFKESLSEYVTKTSLFSMGSDFADFNNDGYTDLIVVDMYPDGFERQKSKYATFPRLLYQAFQHFGIYPQFSRNMLQLSHGGQSFSEIGLMAGVAKTDWSWATFFADFNNDGWKDIFIANGLKRDINDLDFMRLKFDGDIAKNAQYKHNKLSILDSMPASVVLNAIFENNRDLTFSERMEEWGLDRPLNSNGGAFADLDNDGDLDLILNNIDMVASIFENHSSQNYLRLQLTGKGQNKFGIGAKATIYHNGEMQFSELLNARGFESNSEHFIHFGLGDISKIDSVKVVWPGGKRQILHEVAANQMLVVAERDAASIAIQPVSKKESLFENISTKTALDFQHTETDFDDFSHYWIMPHGLSREGPGISVADVNKDGFDDFYVGGAYGQSGALFLQKENGRFAKSNEQPWLHQINYEELETVFFDVNNDSYPDLYIASGSNELYGAPDAERDRLFINDGSGNFTETESPVETNSSCAAAADFDNDGDDDLFVGGFLLPGKYPFASPSYLFKNDGGTFKNMANEVPGLSEVGLTKDAIWADINNDGWQDLVVVGMYMPITIFKNNEGKFENITQNCGLAYSPGWWNTIESGDFDNDGDIDFIAGNVGENNIYNCSKENPVIVYAADFDKSGSLDPVLTYVQNGVRAPFVSRDVFCEQMPKYNNNFHTYISYAKATIDDIFTKEQLDSAAKFSCHTFSSAYIENLGNGKFEMRPLPMAAQVSPIYGIDVFDYTGDGHLDALICGNSFSNYFDQGNYDALKGLLLQGDGNGNFKPLSHLETGFKAEKDAKNIVRLFNQASSKWNIIVTNSNDSLQVFEWINPAKQEQPR